MPKLPINSRPNFSFIHAGANDGVTNDWLHESIVGLGWRGLCIEPQPRLYEKLRETYRDITNVQCVKGAVAAETGERLLFSVSHPHSGFDELCNKLASFDRDVLVANAAIELAKFPELTGTDLNSSVVEESVRCYSVPELIELYSLEPDLIALDIEGCEDEILMSIDFDSIKPEYIFFEAYHLPVDRKHACFERLAMSGYVLRGISEYGIEDFNILARRKI